MRVPDHTVSDTIKYRLHLTELNQFNPSYRLLTDNRETMLFEEVAERTKLPQVTIFQYDDTIITIVN